MATWLDLIRGLVGDYRRVFRRGDPSVERVVVDMAHEAFYDQTTVVKDKEGRVDVEATLLNEGRRQGFLDVMRKCGLTDEDLRQMAGERGREE